MFSVLLGLFPLHSKHYPFWRSFSHLSISPPPSVSPTHIQFTLLVYVRCSTGAGAAGVSNSKPWRTESLYTLCSLRCKIAHLTSFLTVKAWFKNGLIYLRQAHRPHFLFFISSPFSSRELCNTHSPPLQAVSRAESERCLVKTNSW